MSNEIIVKQKKEVFEILTGIETKNHYEVYFGKETPDYIAAEVNTSFLSRMFLKNLRPFTIVVAHISSQDTFITIKRPFRFIFHEIEIFDAEGVSIGRIEKRFTLLHKRYEIFNSTGEKIMEIEGPLLKPWTFYLKKDEHKIGVIKKKFGGLLKEAFTNADSFGLQLTNSIDHDSFKILLSAIFLIDFIHFEKSGS
ncbi:MAG: phospholipid scramblase family protein [Fibrobacterales bacterium]